jgi:glycosyltransferase involved in cell wall biosynthesis
MDIKNKNIIYFSSDEWNSGLKTSQYHIAVRLAENNRVLYVNSIGLRRPTASKSDISRVFDKLKRFFRGIQKVKTNLYVFTPIVVPCHGLRWADRINKFLLIAYIRYYQVKLSLSEPVIFTFLPNIVEILGRFKEKKVIYYCADQLRSFKGVDSGTILEMEKKLLRKADFVFTTSKQLFEDKKKFNKNTHYLPHGVDFEMFKRSLAPGTRIPADMERIPGPVIGFFGHVSPDWLDFSLIRYLAQSHKDWSIVLIGKISADLPDLSGFKNVYLLGSREYNLLPAYCKAFDVAIIPFVISELTRNSNPLKLKEYLAAGKPVVCTSIPELDQFRSQIAIADTPGSFKAAVEEYLRIDREELRIARSRQMSGETWDNKYKELSNIIAGRAKDVS